MSPPWHGDTNDEPNFVLPLIIHVCHTTNNKDSYFPLFQFLFWGNHLYNMNKLVKELSKIPTSFNHNERRRACFSLGRCYGTSSSSSSGKSDDDDTFLSRNYIVKNWLADMTRENNARHLRKKRNAQTSRALSSHDISTGEPVPMPPPPPLSQSATGLLKPTSPEEFKVAPLLARANLIVTRNIEWANLMVGFEQENRYAVVDAYYPQAPVGFISEQSSMIARQILRTRRPFIAYITDSMGNELFRVRRPFWWVTSTIFVEIDGKEIGVVHRRWHLWRRVYDLYLGNKQFAVVENPGFWNWTFILKDIDGNVLAEIDRDFRGFGLELLTDAGQYVIRFGDVDHKSKTGPASKIQDLEVGCPLTLSERAVALALAVSLDNDYFSRHGGWGLPFFLVTE